LKDQIKCYSKDIITNNNDDDDDSKDNRDKDD